jgi:hypothetical protein
VCWGIIVAELLRQLAEDRGNNRMSQLEDVSVNDRAILDRVAPYTMTSVERQLALVQATRYLVRRGIQGCFVECGVWRGGSAMAAILALLDEGAIDRSIYLYDTFCGMTPPTDADKTSDGTFAKTHLERDVHKIGYWCVAGLDDVRSNISSTGYPGDRIHFIEGPVEVTLPVHLPAEPIALLRLDTDWYESTKLELDHLFPLVSPGGVLIVDDYGHWQGARRAVDEYLSAQPDVYFLHRIDYTGRMLFKT